MSNSDHQHQQNDHKGPKDLDLYRVKILHSSATELCTSDESLGVSKGDRVIVPTRHGKELARVQGMVSSSPPEQEDVQTIERKATAQDLERSHTNVEKEAKAFQICRQKITDHGLEMKLVSAHYLIDESKIIFYFTADSRVDFRELVKDLVSVFRMRIELRQIGVRDEARVIGGMGVCGRGFCCHCITDKLKPVSIKMAKEQNLTLNSMKISGPCGRLLCCLSYEYETYRETKKDIPNEGKRIHFQGEQYKVIEINIISKKIRLIGENGQNIEVDLNRFRYDEKKDLWQIH